MTLEMMIVLALLVLAVALLCAVLLPLFAVLTFLVFV